MTQYANHKNATLSVEHTGMWRISWWETNPATLELERIRKTFKLNRIKDLGERKKKADEIIQTINSLLDLGWNSFQSPEDNLKVAGIANIPGAEPPPVVTVVSALERALKIRTLGVALRTASTYRSFVKSLSKWLAENNLTALPIADFTSEHFMEYLFAKSGAGHGNRNLNDHTNFFKTTFEVIRKKLKLISDNPVSEIDYLPESESKLFEPLTDAEIQKIVPALVAYSPRYYLFTRFIPHQYIRPWHIARLKASDIVYTKDYISVSGDSTKNKKNRQKQLMSSIKDMLIEMQYNTLPGDYYLFGKNFEPSPQLYKSLSIRAAEIWKEIVIDGLGINKKMYALKHTSSQYFVNENDNADLKFLQQQMEHHSLTQTEIYLQDKVFKKIDETKTNTFAY